MILSCDTLDDPTDKIYVTNKIEDVNLRVFSMITRVNDPKTLAKHISCEYKCIYYGKKCNSNQKWNSDKCQCACNKPNKRIVCKINYIWNPST